MKRILSILFAFALALSFAACMQNPEAQKLEKLPSASGIDRVVMAVDVVNGKPGEQTGTEREFTSESDIAAICGALNEIRYSPEEASAIYGGNYSEIRLYQGETLLKTLQFTGDFQYYMEDGSKYYKTANGEMAKARLNDLMENAE